MLPAALRPILRPILRHPLDLSMRGATKVLPPLPDGILDVLADLGLTAGASYGVRRLSGNYDGLAMRVRRDSDNAELDIGFTPAGDLDVATLLTFCGPASGFIVGWYRQPGISTNFLQAASGSQPLVVTAGVLDTAGIRPTLRFPGGRFMDAASWGAALQPYTVNLVFKNDPSNGTGASIISSLALAAYAQMLTLGVITMRAPLSGPSITLEPEEVAVLTMVFDGPASVFRKNGQEVAVGDPGAEGFSGIRIGGRVANIFTIRGGISEVIGFPGAPDPALLEILEADQRAYYGIPLLGPELVTNGDFQTAAGWASGPGWTFGAGAATATATAGSALAQGLALTTGALYRVRFSITAQTTAGQGIAFLLGALPQHTPRTGVGTYVEDVTATGASVLQFNAFGAGAWEGSITNVSVRQVLG